MKKIFTFVIAFLVVASLSYAQWVNMNQGFNPKCFTSTVSNLYVGSSLGLYRSTNNGTNFTRISYSTLSGSVGALGVSGIRVFAGTTNGLYYTTDGDTTWTQGNGVTGSITNILVTSNYIFLISQGNVYHSTNNGVSFEGIGVTTFGTALGANASGSVYYFGGRSTLNGEIQGLYTSTNGMSWTLLTTLDSLTISDIGVSNNTNIFVCTKSSGTKPGSIWISTNTGGSWTRSQPVSGNGVSYYSCVLQNPNILVGCDSGIVLSRNNGASWVRKNEGLTNPNARYVSKLFYSNNYVFASVSAELWKRPYADAINAKKISEQIPTTYSLSQNYPNPWNPSTTITYAVPTKGLVTLKVHDALGRLMATLVNEVCAPGTYAVEWNASMNTSGVYFYTMQTSNYSDTKRMVLIK